MKKTPLASLGFIVAATAVFAAQPIRLHPANPRWFEWRGQATALITSAEHYGAVLNLDFDFRRYLETLQREGMRYTRIFAGSYVEPQGAFGIQRNTLAPAPARFLAPWARSDQPGYAGGGNKFDLDRFSPEYLARLKEFAHQEKFTRWLVRELNGFDNLFFEMKNEPWADNHAMGDFINPYLTDKHFEQPCSRPTASHHETSNQYSEPDDRTH